MVNFKLSSIDLINISFNSTIGFNCYFIYINVQYVVCVKKILLWIIFLMLNSSEKDCPYLE